MEATGLQSSIIESNSFWSNEDSISNTGRPLAAKEMFNQNQAQQSGKKPMAPTKYHEKGANQRVLSKDRLTMIKKMRESEKRQQGVNMRSTMPMGIVKPNIQIEQAVARAAETKIVSHRPEDDSSSKKKRYLYDGAERKHPSPSPDMAIRANDPAQTSTFSLGYHTLGAGSLKSSNVVKQAPQAALSFGQKFPK